VIIEASHRAHLAATDIHAQFAGVSAEFFRIFFGAGSQAGVTTGPEEQTDDSDDAAAEIDMYKQWLLQERIMHGTDDCAIAPSSVRCNGA
jgi:hypothetical protein